MSNEAAARPSSAPPSFAGGGFNISRPRWNIAERLAKRVGVPIFPERDEEDEAQAGDGADRANGQDEFPPGHLKHPIAADEQPQAGKGEDQDEGGERDHATHPRNEPSVGRVRRAVGRNGTLTKVSRLLPFSFRGAFPNRSGTLGDEGSAWTDVISRRSRRGWSCGAILFSWCRKEAIAKWLSRRERSNCSSPDATASSTNGMRAAATSSAWRSKAPDSVTPRSFPGSPAACRSQPARPGRRAPSALG